jgi:hypothetical protein
MMVDNKGHGRETTMGLKLSNETVLGRLSGSRWLTPAEVASDLRQCGPMCFPSEEEHKAFRFSTPTQQYTAVRNVLMRLRGKGGVDGGLGADDGREVRVFKLLAG